MRHTPSTILLGLMICLSLSLLVLAGCSSDRTQNPATPSQSPAEPEWLTVNGAWEPQAVALGAVKANAKSGSQAGNPPSTPPGHRSAEIDGAVGGTVTEGRFTLYFPPGSFVGTQLITINDQSGPYIECDLEPEGLQFSAPVTLTVDLAGINGEIGSISVFWYNPDTTNWYDINGAYDLNSHTVSATLAHFSLYRSGRAGW
jgi:hypothetical protein